MGLTTVTRQQYKQYGNGGGRGSLVSQHDFFHSLSRLLEQQDKLRSFLSGYSLRIVGTGQFCHLADDGSFVVPHDWI